MFFSQQHIFTQFGHSVPIEALPHFDFLNGNIEGYHQYLQNSWQYYIPGYTPERIEQQVQKFYSLIKSIIDQGVKKPVDVFIRPNGDTMVFDGNHRAAICSFYGLELPKKYMPLITAITRFIDIPTERYGTQVKGVPYQSIYAPDGSIVLKGRRRDLTRRAELISTKDIFDKNVIDVGCNYGNALMLTRGARSLTGTDIDLKILTAAVRLAVVFQKAVKYKIWDMNAPPDFSDQYDTAFIFSVDAHLKTLAGLEYFVKHNVREVVYYETHVGHEFPEQIKSIFSRVDHLGKVTDRNLYRCIR